MIFIGVCGGRNYGVRVGEGSHDSETVRIARENDVFLRTLGIEIPGGACIVHGGARGADRLAADWADEHGLQTLVAPAHWARGKGAGPARNAVIAALPLVKLIAFPGGAGTADMVAKARSAGIPVVEVKP